MAPDAPGQGVRPHRFRNNDQTPPPRFGCLAPYALAAALGFAALLSFGLGQEGGAGRLRVGPDDFMRVVRVLDWVDGQGWNDMAQRRLNPPAGVDMYRSRLADLPLAAVVTPAEPRLGGPGAVNLAVPVVPPLLGGAFAALFLWAAAPLIPNRRAALPAAVFTTSALVIPPGADAAGTGRSSRTATRVHRSSPGISDAAPLARTAIGGLGDGHRGRRVAGCGARIADVSGRGHRHPVLDLARRGGPAAMALTCFGVALAAMGKQKAPGKAYRRGLTVFELFERFPDEASARRWFEGVRWANGRYCGHCGSTNTREVPHEKPMP